MVRNLASVLGVEYICAAQGVDFHAPLKPGAGTLALHGLLRSQVPHLDQDRVIHEDLRIATSLIESGAALAAAERGLGAELP